MEEYKSRIVWSETGNKLYNHRTKRWVSKRGKVGKELILEDRRKHFNYNHKLKYGWYPWE